MAEDYANIREILAPVLGQRLLDITQHDKDEFAEDGQCYVCFHFENGATVTFPVDEDGFDIETLD